MPSSGIPSFDLTGHETEVLLFFFLISNSPVCEEYLRRGWKNFSRIATFRRLGHIPLGMKKVDVTAVFSRGTLFKARILQNSGLSLDVAHWFERYLCRCTVASQDTVD